MKQLTFNVKGETRNEAYILATRNKETLTPYPSIHCLNKPHSPPKKCLTCDELPIPLDAVALVIRPDRWFIVQWYREQERHSQV